MAMQFLSNCIASVEFSCRTLEASNVALAAETQDMRRLASALRSKRHFDLVSETDIRSVRNQLAAEIAPQLKELINRAEEALQRDERQAKTLKAKVTQQSTLLEQLAQQHGVPIEKLRGALQNDEGDADLTIQKPQAPPSDDSKIAEELESKLKDLRLRRRALQERLSLLEGESI